MLRLSEMLRHVRPHRVKICENNYNTPRNTLLEVITMRKIADSHIHIRLCQDNEITTMLDDMASVGVTATCILPLPYRGCAENLAGLYHKMTYKKMDVYAFGGLHNTDRYAEIPPEVTAKALIELGCDGFKIMNCPSLRAFLGHGFNDERY